LASFDPKNKDTINSLIQRGFYPMAAQQPTVQPTQPPAAQKPENVVTFDVTGPTVPPKGANIIEVQPTTC
jgi:hypothetical protein